MPEEKHQSDTDVEAIKLFNRFSTIIEDVISRSFDAVQKELEQHRKDQKENMHQILETHRAETRQILENGIEISSLKIAKEVDRTQKPRIGIFSVGHTLVTLFEKMAIGLGFGLGFSYFRYGSHMPDKVALTVLFAIVLGISLPIKFGYKLIFQMLQKLFGNEYSVYIAEIIGEKNEKK